MLLATVRKIGWPQVYQAGVGAGVLVVIWGVSNLVIDMAGFFLHLNPRTAAKYGFLIGFSTAATLAAMLAIFSRRLQIYPDAVYGHALRFVQRNAEAQARLGGEIAPGKLKAYDHYRGHLNTLVSASSSAEASAGASESPLARLGLAWDPPRVQLIFSVAGPKFDGVCTAEATKVGGGLDFRFIGLDVMDPAETRILVAGDAERMAEKKDALRDLINFKSRTRHT